MARDWTEAPLSSLTDSNTPVTYGVVKPGAEVPDGVLLIRGGDIADGRILTEQLRTISKGVSGQYKRTLLRGGEIVMSLVGNPGQVAIVPASLRGANIARQAALIRLRPEVDARFVTYFLGSRVGQEALGAHSRGSVQQVINLRDLKTVAIPTPPLAEQRAIAHILGTMDDKIALNRRLTEMLEAMARALFKSWFVDFDAVRARAEGRDPGLPQPLADLFPDSLEDSELGVIPKGWEVSRVGRVAEVIDCLHSKKPERLDAGMPLLQLVNIRDDGLIDMDDTYFISEFDYRQWTSRMEAMPGDCVITNVGRVGAVGQMPSGHWAALGRNMTGVRCRTSFAYPTFLVEALLSQAMKNEIMLNMDSGTILDALNVRSIPNLRLVHPRTPSVLDAFEDMARPLRAAMELRLAESRTLAAIRDALLPKLISGELRVPDLERVVADAAT